MRALRFFAPKAADARLLALPFLSTAITNEEAQLAVALGVERLDSSKYVREHLEPVYRYVYRPCPRPSAVRCAPLCYCHAIWCCPAMLLCCCKGAVLLCCCASAKALQRLSCYAASRAVVY